MAKIAKLEDRDRFRPHTFSEPEISYLSILNRAIYPEISRNRPQIAAKPVCEGFSEKVMGRG
jgi:hypothetical protein